MVGYPRPGSRKGAFHMEQNRRIAVLGAGTMGVGMAVTYALGGYEVGLYSRTEKTLERAQGVIQNSLSLLTEEGGLSRSDAAAAAGRIRSTTSVETAVQGAWYVAETVAEVAEVKAELYRRLDTLLPEEVILSSNTSALNVFDLIPPARQSHAVIAHFFAPAHILPLVEVIRGPETQEAVMETVLELHRSCGKTPIRMERFVPGFIINRLQRSMNREVMFLLENGYCSPEDIDLAVKASLMPRGMLLGLVQRMDFTGLDMMANSFRDTGYTAAPPAQGIPRMIEEHYQRGELGVKTGRGFYDYAGQSYGEILRRRDSQLLKSVRLAEELLADPLETKKG